MKKEIIKPFDLEAYNKGAKIRTRDGYEVRIICTDAKDKDCPIIGLVTICSGNERTVYYTLEGKVRDTKGTICVDDLVIVEEGEELNFWSENVNNFIDGYYISLSSEIYAAEHQPNDTDSHKMFATEKQAKSAKAMARISQIMANDIKHFGGVITDEEWKDDRYKYVIYRSKNRIEKTCSCYEYYFLAFHEMDQRDLFLEKYRDLVKNYLMLK